MYIQRAVGIYVARVLRNNISSVSLARDDDIFTGLRNNFSVVSPTCVCVLFLRTVSMMSKRRLTNISSVL